MSPELISKEPLMATTSITISGMTCNGCVASVSRVLQAQPGVIKAQVTLTPPNAQVEYDAARIDPTALRKAIQEAGYGTP
ncbi:MAG: hypothetical protein AMXMBFR6_03570 [Betaproteobacteria bacterium]|jgi:copper chaperone